MTARRLVVLLALAAVTFGCGPERTHAVRPQLEAPNPVYDFGPVPVLNQHTLEIPLRNVGRATLHVAGAHIVEADAPFKVTAVPTDIEEADQKSVVVAFTPPAEQAYQATVHIDSDDPELPAVEVTVKGTGSTRAIMEVTPDSIDFGRVAEGTSAARTITITSAGTADLIIDSISFVAGSSTEFGFLGSVKTPAVVKAKDANGLPGKIQIAVRYTVDKGAPDSAQGAVRITGTDPDHREVVVALSGTVNRAPIPDIKPLGNGAPGMEVTLDGTGSSDPDGDNPLTFKWTLRQKPLGSKTQIAQPDQASTSMTLDPDVPGSYEVQLDVVDAAGAKNLAPARATIVAAPAQKLLIEMFWDNSQTDIDLHFLQTPSSPVGVSPGDCSYMNPTPDWGVSGDASDDPSFLRDALTGYGPEVVGYTSPADGKYRIVVEFANAHFSTTPQSAVTVRIYEFGVVKAELHKTLSQAGEYWEVADLDWPSGTVTELQ